MHTKYGKLLGLALVLGFCLLPVLLREEASAQSSRVMAEASVNKIRDFSRVSFKWPVPVYLTAESAGNKVTIRFEKPAQLNTQQIMASLPGTVKAAELSADGQTLTLTLAAPYRVRSFVSGKVNGVDLLPGQTQQAAASKPTPAASKPAPATLKPAANVNKPSVIAANNVKFTKPEPLKPVVVKLPATANNLQAKTAEALEALAPSADAEVLEEKSTAASEPIQAKTEVEAKPAKAEGAAQEKTTVSAPATPTTKPAANPAPAAAASQTAPAEPSIAAEPAVKKQMTDAEALAEKNKQLAAVPQTLEVDSKTKNMTDAEALAYRNEQAKNAAAQAATPAAEQPQVAKPPEKPATVAAAAEPTKALPAEEKPSPPAADAEKQATAELADAAKTAEPETALTPPTESTDATSAENAEIPATEGETAEAKPDAEAALPDTSAEAAAEPEPQPVLDESASAQQDAATQGENGFRVRATLDNEILTMTFPWLDRTAAAAFVRNGMAWIVFSTAANLDVTEVNGLVRSGATITQLPIAGATVLYMPVNVGSGLRMTSVENTFKWVVQLMPVRQTSKSPLAVSLSTEPPLKPHVFLPLLESAPLVEITDPMIGDSIKVLPVYAQDVGVSPGRSFVDFTLLETSQGVAVQPFADDTQIEVVRNGVRITTTDGATITPGLPLVEEVQRKQEEVADSVFMPYKNWQPEEGKTYADEIKKLEHALISEDDKNDLKTHLRIAQLYLAQGFAVEALGYLNNIKRIDPQYYIDKRLSALHGAANFLMQRYSDAAQDFSVPELKDMPESAFWQDMLSELLGNPSKAFDYESNYEPYIKEYPPVFRQRIGIIAADRAIAAKEYNAALKIFDQMNEHKLINEVADYINYMMGKIALETQKPEDGYKLWNTLLEGKGSEFVKVRTEFSLIIEQMRRKEIDMKDAVDRLERLAIRWRGDNLELAVLTALSDIYKANKDWPDDIRISRALNEAFPNTVAAVEASRSMDEAFISMFDKGETGTLSTLDLLFIYNEYRDLIPQDETGDRIVDNLTDKMLQMDMLDQAETILEQRMRYRFEHQTRSKVGAKLARIYLMDKKPEQALNALQLSVFGMLPEALLQERTYLTAEALLDLKRYEDLELLLAGDESEQAESYRLQAAWQQKDWQAVAKMGESMLQKRQDATRPLNDIQADAVVKLAMSYVAQEESEQIAYMRDYFLPLMKGKRNEAVFEYLTRPYVTLTTTNFDDVMESMQKTRSFIGALNTNQANTNQATTQPPQANNGG